MNDEKTRIDQTKRMTYDPRTGAIGADPPHADKWRAYHGQDAWLFNPWTGSPRDTRDIGSDVTGLLIVPPKAGNVEHEGYVTMSDDKAKEARDGLEMLRLARAAFGGAWADRSEPDAGIAHGKAVEFIDNARRRFEHLAALLEREPERKAERPRGVPEDAEFDVLITTSLDGRVIEERFGRDDKTYAVLGYDPDDAEKIGRDLIKGARLARLATKLDDDPSAG